MGHNGEEDERNHATAPGNPFCGEDEARRRVHLSPTSLNASLGVTSGKKVLVLDFSVEVDVHGDGVYRLLKWDEFVVHHDRRLHVILVGSDYSTFVHSHPVSHVCLSVGFKPPACQCYYTAPHPLRCLHGRRFAFGPPRSIFRHVIPMSSVSSMTNYD